METGHFAAASERLLDEAAFLFGDVTFKTVDEGDAESETLAHRCILAAMSPVFKSMFSAGLKEQETSVVEITDMSTASLRCFLKLVYTGHLVDDELRNHGLNVLSACHKYCLPLSLKNTCVSYLSKNITVENCLALMDHAELFDEELLASKCKSFISGNLTEFILLNGQELAVRKPELLFSLVKDKLPALQACVSDAISELKKQLHKPAKSQLRMFAVSNHRIERIFKKKDPISSISQEESLRAEEIPASETPYGTYVLHVHHFRTGAWSYEAFGEPFTMNVNFNETLRRVKQRIRTRLGVSKDMFESTNLSRG